MTQTQTIISGAPSRNTIVHTWQLYCLVIVLNWMLILLFEKMVLTRDFYYSILSTKMELSRIDELTEFVRRFTIINVMFIPFIVFLKIAFVTSLLQLPFLTMNIDVSYYKIFRGVTIANFIYIVAGLLKCLWMHYLPPESITNEILSMNLLAITNLIDGQLYSAASYSLLNTINIFEAVWIIYVVYYLRKHGGIPLVDACIDTVSIWVGLLFAQYGVLYYFTQIF